MQDANQPDRQVQAARRPEILSRGGSNPRNWLREPKTAVWVILLAAIALGGWRKLRIGWRARKAVARLEDPRVTPEEVKAAAEHGRAAVWELLRIFSSTTSEPLREAAGQALAAALVSGPARRRGRASDCPPRLHRHLERPQALSASAPPSCQ